MSKKNIVSCMLTVIVTLFFQPLKAQQNSTNIIQTGAIFLLTTPDARGAAMGDGGVATSPDESSLHWNPAKIAFLENQVGVTTSYAPWLRSLTSDTNLYYLSGYYHLSERNTISAAIRYFSLGIIQLMDASANSLGTYNPYELAFDGAFARRFNDHFSIGVALRYIKSSLSNGQFLNNQQRQAAVGFAVDVSGYHTQDINLFGKKSKLNMGINISNIGPRIRYQTNGTGVNLPTNLKLGAATTIDIDDDNKFTLSLDLNKLLVPTNNDATSSVASSVFSSFSNPGGLKTISYSLGTEYWLKQQFALRLGYFYEHPSMGNRRYATTGAGFKYQSFSLDVAYVLANPEVTPLAQTLRFTLGFNFKK